MSRRIPIAILVMACAASVAFLQAILEIAVARANAAAGQFPDFTAKAMHSSKRARLELALTQQSADIADRENADKALDARAGLELGPRVVVELRDFIDRR
jgi:hypothetical protein